jgi:TRAP-type C4-dicarboxylate transport system permease small subunit
MAPEMMTNLREYVDRMLEWLLILLMALMVFNVIWQVLTRFVLQDPSSYTEEVARYLLIWLGLLGAGYCVGQRSHLAIDVVTSRFSEPLKSISTVFSHAVIFLFAVVVLVTGGYRLVEITLSFHQTSAALQIPLGYVYLALPFSGLLIAFYSIMSLIEVGRMFFTEVVGENR